MIEKRCLFLFHVKIVVPFFLFYEMHLDKIILVHHFITDIPIVNEWTLLLKVIFLATSSLNHTSYDGYQEYFWMKFKNLWSFLAHHRYGLQLMLTTRSRNFFTHQMINFPLKSWKKLQKSKNKSKFGEISISCFVAII